MGANTINDDLRELDAIHGGVQSDISVKTGYDLDVESGATFSIAGTAVTSTAAELNIMDTVTATAAELNILDGVTATAAELSKVYLQTEIADISSANTGWVVSPVAGTLTKVLTVIDTAITVGDAVLSTTVAGGTVVTVTHTIATSGSAAGTVDTSVPADNNIVAVGDNIKIVTDNGSTDASKAVVVFEITL